MIGLRICMVLGGILLLALLPPSSLALEDCSPQLKEIDAKIAAARAAGQNVEMAEDMRKSVAESCSFFDERTLQQMIQSLDMLLPAMTALEAQAEAMEAAAAERQVPAAAAPQIHAPAPRLAAIGRSIAGQLNDRPDRMNQFGIWDMDLKGDRARIVYHTRPTREQLGWPDWELVVYVVEVDGRGSPIQHLIDRRQAFDHRAIALRRGHDEVLLQRGPEERGGLDILERWSISPPSLISSVNAPTPAWEDGSRARSWDPFLLPTRDGNLFYAGIKPAPARAKEHTLVWFESSPSGEVIGQHQMIRPAQIAPHPAVETRDGGAALLINLLSDSDVGLETRLNTPIRRQVGGRNIHAVAISERRLLLLGDNGAVSWESPAVERMLAWHGDLSVPQNLPMAEMMQQSQQQMEIMAAADLATNANRSIDYLDVGLKRVDMVKELPDGRFIALVNDVADRSLVPPVHGQYLVTIDGDSVEELTYLEPLADTMDLKFTALTVAPDGRIYVLAINQDTGGKLVVRVREDGTPEGYVASSAPRKVTLEGLVADGAGVWVIGRGFMDGRIGDRIWTERLLFEPGD